MKFFLFPAIFLALFCSAFSQDFSAAHQKIRVSFEQRDYRAAITELENLQKTNRNLFEINNYDYLLARTAEKSGDFAKAMAGYQSAASRDSVLKDYALWHLSQLARSSGNLMLERIYLQQILASNNENLFLEAVNTRLARSYFESRNFETAVQLLNAQTMSFTAQKSNEQRTTNNEQTARFRENLVYLGQAYLQTGKTAEAKEIFTKLTNNLPNPAQPDDFALAGALGLDEIESGKDNFGKQAPALPDFEHLRRALIYQFNRNFPLARLHYRAIVEKHPASGNVPDALYQIGRGLAQEGKFAEAIEWFERTQAEFPAHPVSKDALTQEASAYARVNKPQEAILHYQKFIEKYPEADNLERGYLNIVDILRDAGDDAEALKWAAKTREAFKGKLPEAVALFAQARIHISQNDWQNALNDLNELQNFADLGGTRVPGGTNKAEVIFLKGLALENLQRYPEAIEVYLSIPDGRNEYYGWRATERLRQLAANEKTKSFAVLKTNQLRAIISQPVTPTNIENIRLYAQSLYRLTNEAIDLESIKKFYELSPNYQKLPEFNLLEFGRQEVLKEKRQNPANDHQNLADELLFLGLYDEGTPGLDVVTRGRGDAAQNPKSQIPNPKSDNLNYTLAVFYKRGEMANRAVGFIEPLWRKVPADYQIELIPREQIELLYPAPYADALLKFAPVRKVDPRFVLSIMRQESRFRADVKSAAAARGLMQFISTTANQIASELGKENFRQDELYHPPTAVLFGSQYLSNIYKQFPAKDAAVAASYNGGEDNMARWFARSKSAEPDRYVPEIIFSQSKDYACKVMTNYRIYQMFYDENLRSK